MSQRHSRKILVTLVVRDLERSMDFLSKLGFDFDPRLTHEAAACMILSEEGHGMLLTEPFFKSFTRRELCDDGNAAKGFYALSCESRAEVDEMVEKAVSAGGEDATDSMDMGFIYGRTSTISTDNRWEVFWLDVAAQEGREISVRHRRGIVEILVTAGFDRRPSKWSFDRPGDAQPNETIPRRPSLAKRLCNNRATGLFLSSALLSWGWTLPATAEDANRRGVVSGRTVWGVSGAVGIADGGRAGHSGSLALDFSRTLTDSVGPGWLRGRMGVTVELVPVFVVSQASTTYAAGFNVLGRHYLDRGGPLRPFVTLGAGMLISAKEIPDGVANLNFTPQAGLGFTFLDEGGRVYSVEIRLHHISNGGRAEPNPGINSVMFQFGVLFAGRESAAAARLPR